MSDAVFVREHDKQLVLLAASVSDYEVWQMGSGEAAYFDSADAASSGDYVSFRTRGKVTMPKTTGVVLIPGLRAWWDHSANKVNYKKVNDRDFYVGRVVEDATSAAVTCVVDLNADPPYDLDLMRDPYATSPTGTQALGGFLPPQRQGGGLYFNLTATSEVQKTDALSVDGFAKGANAIVEFAFRVPTGGSTNAVDYSIGIANATHATDADSITDSIFIHIDGGSTNLNVESDDGTTEVAATDSTLDYTAGSTFAERVEVWFDMRNPADVQVYINAALVLGSSVFNVDASTATWKLLVHIEKTSGTATADLIMDWMRARYSEQ